MPPAYAEGTYHPALDYSGTSVNNLVSNEQQIVALAVDETYLYLIARYAPFFATSLVVSLINPNNSVTPLTVGLDYHYAFPFIGASRALGVPIYAGIRIINTSITGKIALTYQCLGNDWVKPATIISDIASAFKGDPCATTWEQYADYSNLFPIVSSAWDRADPTRLSDVSAKLSSIENAMTTNYLARDFSPQYSHLNNFNNPHQVTATQLGLGYVVNLRAATLAETGDPSLDNLYVESKYVVDSVSHFLPAASTTVSGIMKLNTGTAATLGNDNTRGLTIVGFSRLIKHQDNDLGVAFNKGQQPVQVTPFPFTYPIVWNGNNYANETAFVSAVQTATGFTSLEYNRNTGTFFFPRAAALPDLTHT